MNNIGKPFLEETVALLIWLKEFYEALNRCRA
jgi:hypothetical protein